MRHTTPTTNMAAVMPRNASAALGERYPARASQRLKGPRSPTSAGSAGASSRAVVVEQPPPADAANDPDAKPHGHDEKPEDHEEQQRRRVHKTPQYFKRLSHEVQKIPIAWRMTAPEIMALPIVVERNSSMRGGSVRHITRPMK